MVSSIAAHTFYKAKSQIQGSEVSEPRGGCRDWSHRKCRFVSSCHFKCRLPRSDDGHVVSWGRVKKRLETAKRRVPRDWVWFGLSRRFDCCYRVSRPERRHSLSPASVNPSANNHNRLVFKPEAPKASRWASE